MLPLCQYGPCEFSLKLRGYIRTKFIRLVVCLGLSLNNCNNTLSVHRFTQLNTLTSKHLNRADLHQCVFVKKFGIVLY